MIKPMIVGSSGGHKKKRTRRSSRQNKHDEEQPKPCFTGSLLTVLVEEKKESLGMIDTLSINLEDGNKNLGDDRIYFSEPRALDICCGRGKGSFWHPGNLIFQMVIRNSMDEYAQATSKRSKSAIVSMLLNSLHVDHNLRFVKKDPVVGKWFVLPLCVAHEKTGHAIRDQLSAAMRQKQQPPCQEKSSLSSPTTISCSSSFSSDSSNRNTKQKGKKAVPHKTKHQVQRKKIKKTANSKLQVFVEEERPELLRCHTVEPGEEEHQDPLSNHSLGRHIAVHSSSFGDDNVFLDFEPFVDFALDTKDLPVPLPPQGMLPKSPPVPCQLSVHEVVSVEDMSLLSASPKSTQVKIVTTQNSVSLRHFSPEKDQEFCDLPSTLQATHAGFNINEEYLEPTRFCNLPFHALGTEKSWPTDCRVFPFPEAWDFGVGHNAGATCGGRDWLL